MPTGYLYSWTGHSSSNFGTAGNWFNETTGTTATAVPGVNDEAIISAAGSIAGNGAVFDLAVTGTASGLSLTGALNGSYVFVGGTVSLASGASLTSGNLIDIGDNSSNNPAGHVPTTLTVGAGASLSATLNAGTSLDLLVGYAGGTGTLNVTGSGATATSGVSGMDVGDNGAGAVNVTGGGQLDVGLGANISQGQGDLLVGNGGTGTILVSGAGSKLDAGDTGVIGYGGTGRLTVASGASLIIGTGTDSLFVGDSTAGGPAASGTLDVAGASAMLSGLVEVGNNATGRVDISGGSTVTAGGSAAPASFVLGQSGTGSLVVTGGAKLTAAGAIDVGGSGHGEFDVGTATVIINGTAGSGAIALAAGLDAGSSGVITIGAGSVTDANSLGVVIGQAGSGTLAIAAGGLLATGSGGANAALTIGESQGATGTVGVFGAGARLSVAGQLAVGSAGTGSLGIATGGTVVVTTSATGAGLVVAAAGGSGVLSMNGGSLSVTGQTDIGEQGRGSLSIAGGATVTMMASGQPALVVSAVSGGTGSVLISDAATRVTLTGGLTVGSETTGALTLQNGATLTAVAATSALPGVVIGALAGASTVTVTGAKTTLADTGQFQVGGATASGGGSLTISAGATVTVALDAGQTIPGATIGDATNALPSGVLVTGAGSAFSIAGDLEIGAESRALLNIVGGAHAHAGTIHVSGFSGGAGTVIVNGAGSSLSAGSLSLGGSGSRGLLTVVSGGAVSVTGSIGITGNVAMGGGTISSGTTLGVNAGSTIMGQGQISAKAIVDLGSIGLARGTLTCVGTVKGAGSLSIAGGGKLVIATGETSIVAFGSGGGTLQAAAAPALGGIITGWSAGDVVDLTGSIATSGTFANGRLTLYGSNHQSLSTLAFGGSLTSANFSVAQVHGEGAVISYHS